MPLNKPSPRLAILRAQLAAEADAIRLQRASYKISSAVGCSCPVPAPDADSLPLPPSYWEDMEEMWPSSADTLASAKPAAKQPAEPRTNPVPWDQWHAKAMRDMVKPSQQPAQKASTHSVCIRAYDEFTVGTVLPVPCDPSLGYWLPCDESGWVTHVPTADAVCPVPDGLKFEVRLRDSGMWCPSSNEGLRNALGVCWWRKGLHNRAIECNADIIAWRPIAQS